MTIGGVMGVCDEWENCVCVPNVENETGPKKENVAKGKRGECVTDGGGGAKWVECDNSLQPINEYIQRVQCENSPRRQ